jgi:hypothetical protein
VVKRGGMIVLKRAELKPEFRGISDEKAKPTTVELGVEVSGMQKADEPAPVR